METTRLTIQLLPMIMKTTRLTIQLLPMIMKTTRLTIQLLPMPMQKEENLLNGWNISSSALQLRSQE
jgi:hypothetical protein